MEKLGAVRQMLEAGTLDAALSRLTGGDPRRERAVGVLDGFRRAFGAGAAPRRGGKKMGGAGAKRLEKAPRIPYNGQWRNVKTMTTHRTEQQRREVT